MLPMPSGLLHIIFLDSSIDEVILNQCFYKLE